MKQDATTKTEKTVVNNEMETLSNDLQKTGIDTSTLKLSDLTPEIIDSLSDQQLKEIEDRDKKEKEEAKLKAKKDAEQRNKVLAAIKEREAKKENEIFTSPESDVVINLRAQNTKLLPVYINDSGKEVTPSKYLTIENKKLTQFILLSLSDKKKFEAILSTIEL